MDQWVNQQLEDGHTSIWFAKVSVFFWCPLCLCAWDPLASWHDFFSTSKRISLKTFGAIITTPPFGGWISPGVCDPNGHVVLRVSPKSMVPANGDRWAVDARNQRVHILNGRILVRGIKLTGIDLWSKSHFVKWTTIGISPYTFYLCSSTRSRHEAARIEFEHVRAAMGFEHSPEIQVTGKHEDLAGQTWSLVDDVSSENLNLAALLLFCFLKLIVCWLPAEVSTRHIDHIGWDVLTTQVETFWKHPGCFVSFHLPWRSSQARKFVSFGPESLFLSSIRSGGSNFVVDPPNLPGDFRPMHLF